MRKKGFSLIELLVVTTIIIVLTTLGLISYRTANIKARDGKRKADLEQVRSALEMYRSELSVYPATGWTAMETALKPTYMKEIPTDPRSYDYVYVQTNNYDYELHAFLEGGGTDTGQDCGGSPVVDCNYQVTNP